MIVGCTATDKDAGTDTGTDTDDSATEEIAPCADGWGAIDDLLDVQTAVHVAPDGSPQGPGTVDQPFDTLEAALAANPQGADLALWPGSYPTALTLFVDSGAGIDHSGTRIVGCSSDEVRLTGVTTDAVLSLVGVTDILLAGVGTEGGYRGLEARGGADLETLDVVVSDAVRTGVFLSGTATTGALRGLTITDPVPEDDGSYGWGLVIQDATVSVDDTRIENAHGVGALVHFGDVDVTGLQIQGVATDAAGLFGRGLQLQELAQGQLEDVEIRQAHDAGVFAHRTLLLDLNNIWILDTGGGLTAEDGEATGDGLVVTRADGNEAVDTFQVSVTDSIFEGSARAGVVLDGVTATLVDVTTPDSALSQGGVGVWAQNGAEVSGDSVQATQPLKLNLTTLGAD